MDSTYFERNEKLIIFGLLAIFFTIGITTSLMEAETYDEPYHLSSGYSYFSGDYRMNPEHPIMLKMFAASPLLMYGVTEVSMIPGWNFPITPLTWSESLFYSNSYLYLISGRIIMLLLGVLFGFVLYLLSKQIFGLKAGLLSLLFYSFSPNILGHAKLITTDVGLAGFLIIFMYFLWKYFEFNSWINVFLSGLFLGFLLLTKYSAVYFVGVFFVVILLFIFLRYLSFKSILHYFYICVIALFVMNCFYLFDGSFSSLSDFDYLESNAMNTLSDGILGSVPIPLPKYYVVGLDMVKAHNERGHLSYMNGEYSQTGFWHYFLELFFLKTPIAFLILLFAFVYFRFNNFLKVEYLFFIVPLILFFVLASLSNIHIGVRHIFPVYLLLFVLMGDLANVKMTYIFERVFICLIFLFVLTSLFTYPHYISYTNNFAVGLDSNYFADSNLDWGQDKFFVEKYLEHNPDVIWNPGCEYTSGRILVNVNHYLGIVRERDCYSWLENRLPVDNIGGSNYLFIVE